MANDIDITVQEVTTREGLIFVAHGPGGHHWLLGRLTAAAARADGLAYFMATRELVDGRWEVR